eukprot:366242-Chlamydomonas_euryale.AAC.5
MALRSHDVNMLVLRLAAIDLQCNACPSHCRCCTRLFVQAVQGWRWRLCKTLHAGCARLGVKAEKARRACCARLGVQAVQGWAWRLCQAGRGGCARLGLEAVPGWTWRRCKAGLGGCARLAVKAVQAQQEAGLRPKALNPKL